MLRKIGLTGGIGSGKSKVAEMLAAELSCILIDADEVCRKLLEPQEAGWQAVSRTLGPGYFTKDGTIDRPLLRRDLFTDDRFRQQVNDIIHPLVKGEIEKDMARIIDSRDDARVLVEVPLLYEVGWENLFDTVVVVFAEYEICLSRLMDRDGVKRDVAVKELASQMDLAEKVLKADHVIDNSGMLADTLQQVKHLAGVLAGEGGQ